MPKGIRRVVAICFVAACAALVVYCVMPNRVTSAALRRAVMLRFASDLSRAWHDTGELHLTDIRRILGAMERQSDRFEVTWDGNNTQAGREFAVLFAIGDSPLDRVLVIDSIEGKGVVVARSGYQWLSREEAAKEARRQNCVRRAVFCTR